MTDVFLKNETDTMLDCGHPKSVATVGNGYALDKDGKTFCYECCGENDKIWMDGGNHQVLYLQEKKIEDKNLKHIATIRGEIFEAVNWPSTLRIPVRVKLEKRKYSRNGFPIDRVHVYFTWNKMEWSGKVGNVNTGSCFIARPLKGKK